MPLKVKAEISLKIFYVTLYKLGGYFVTFTLVFVVLIN